MIQSSDSLNTGGVYNPTSDTWTATTTTGVPSGRNSHAAAWTGSRMIVWGGDVGGYWITSGGVYDPGGVQYTLTVSTAGGNGSGTVVSSPAGIDCGADCTESYDAGTAVTLTPTPATGSTFTSWSGDCTPP